VTELENFIVIDRALFYSFEKKEYLPISLFPLTGTKITESNGHPKETMGAEEKKRAYLLRQGPLVKSAELHPYYGYDGWYNDVIDLYEGRNDLTDWELNALARSYQTKGVSMLADLTGYGLEEERFNLPPGQNSMTDEQVKTYLDINRMGLEIYKKLHQKNPGYMTPVGPIYTKYSNEIMDAFLQLMIHQNEATARKVLQPDLYDDYLLKSARNLLNSCPQDGVLITWGDTDTYPLYYLQATENFRTDVVIANSSLLSFPRYVSLVYSGPFDAKPLKTSLPKVFFEEVIITFSMPAAGTRPFIEIKELFDEMNKEQNLKPQFYGRYTQFEIKEQKVIIPVPENKASSETEGRKPIELEFNYVYPGTMVQWDVIWSNEWNRALCFSLTCLPQEWKFFKTNLMLEGLVYRVHADRKPEVKKIGDGMVNVARSKELWTEVFEWNNESIITRSDKAPFHGSYFLVGVSLAKTLKALGRQKEALAILQSMPVHFPNNIDPWEEPWIVVAEALAELGDLETAKSIGLTIADNLSENGLEDESDFSYLRAKNNLYRLGEKYGMRELMDASDKL
jgi:hypothetical protein